MSPNQTALARKNLDKRLTPLREGHYLAPPGGWVKAIREALGLTARQLADRMNTVPSRISKIEKDEVNGGTSLRTLREAAEAMNCTLIYAIVPTKPLDDILRDQAERKAEKNLWRNNHTMKLENQALTSTDLRDERERLVRELLAGSPRRVWDNE